jgi:hypothetical protein
MASTQLINTHLAFGDAQTLAMLDPARSADKETRHFTGQKCLATCTELRDTDH